LLEVLLYILLEKMKVNNLSIQIVGNIAGHIVGIFAGNFAGYTARNTEKYCWKYRCMLL